jgi:IS1 family transposase
MNKLDLKKRARVLACLVEGNSIRATVRMTAVAKNTVVKLLADVGAACAEYQNEALRNLPCKRIQADEIWPFVYVKQKNVKTAKATPEGAGDVWTWTALDADTKLMVSWALGPRDAGMAHDFMLDLADRLTSRVQLTTDGHRAYIEAVPNAFSNNLDYTMLVKVYGDAPNKGPERKYSCSEFVKCEAQARIGDPEPEHISTSYVERQNLTMRMSMRRFTRLTNGFSKKLENLGHAVALHFMYYNFGRIHQTLRVTPAMEAGISDHVWEMTEIAALAD